MTGIRIVHLTGPVFDALAAGGLPTANALSPVPLTDYLAGPECRGTWRMRSRQARADPDSPAWVTGIIWDESRRLAVGRAGFHGAPDADGTVEIGYAVDPRYRRRGYARTAPGALLHRAVQDSRVRRARVSISPDNPPSYHLAAQFGFRKVGEQWDDEDGLEYVYELPTPPFTGRA